MKKLILIIYLLALGGCAAPIYQPIVMKPPMSTPRYGKIGAADDLARTLFPQANQIPR